ncbi:MAG: hypothetical protein IT370_13835 [Deltaproteobacteria bacterium]|nr:hypothetical protein [Deltaproteobacteria bacterium]
MSFLLDLLGDPEEGPLLRPLFSGLPVTEAQRAAYRDFVVGRGGTRGELLLLAEQLSAPVAPANAPAMRARLLTLVAEVDPLWWGCVSGHGWTLNCVQAPPGTVRFAYDCPRLWQELLPTGDARVRDCAECQQQVHLCSTLDEAAAHARAGHCISVPSQLAGVVHRTYEERTRMVTGRPHLPSYWAADIFK